MPSIHQIQTALQALRKAAMKGKARKSVVESIDSISSSAILLNSSSPSALTFEKLASVFRVPLLPLYASYTDHALAAASAILSFLLDNCIQPCLLRGENQDMERQVGWERVTHSLLSGVIDFLEDSNNDKTKSSISKALYAPICVFFFFREGSSEGSIGITLRCTAYMLLSDAATLHHENQSKLRDNKLLGAQTLGLTISRTRDFAVLETLLNIFAILLPSSSAPQKRSSYIQEVFRPCGKEILELLDAMPTSDWDEIAAKVIDILAASDINFPQPFDVDEVLVCDVKYPQPEVSDRFYIDRKSFFVNVRREDGLYEDLQIKYNSIGEIRFESASENTVLVTMELKIAPKLGEQSITARGGSPALHVHILNCDMPRFNKALYHRGLNKVIATSRSSRISLSEYLTLDDNGPQSQTPLQSPSQKVKKVENFYEVDQRETRNDKQHAVDVHVTSNEVTMSKCSGSDALGLFPNDCVVSTAVTTPGAVLDDPMDSKQEASITKLSAEVFGETDEELSDVDEIEKVPAKAKGRKSREENPTPRSITAPTKVIVISDTSDNEIATKPKPSVLTSRATKKRQIRRIESDRREITVVKPMDAKKLTGGEHSKNALMETTPPEKSQSPNSEGESSVEKKPLIATTVSGPAAPSIHPLQDAAATVSKTLSESDYGNPITDPQESLFPSLNAGTGTIKAVDHESADDSATMDGPYSKAKMATRKTEQTVPSTRIALSPETNAPRSSSPISKIARMKAKNKSGKNKSVKTSTGKRAADKASSAYAEESSRKRLRVDAKIQVHEDRVVNTSTPKKRGRPRGRKANTAGPRKAEVEQSRDVRTPQETLAPAAPALKKSSPKANLKKENLKKSEAVPEKPANPITSKIETKIKALLRIPLQTIPDSSNREHVADPGDTPFTASPVGKVNLDRPDSALPTEEGKNAVFPSLEDILLKGAQVEKCPVPRETKESATTNVDNPGKGTADRSFDPIMSDDLGNHEDVGEFKDILRGEPHTPSPQKITKAVPLPRAPAENPYKKTFEFDTEGFDLTDDDIREVLQSLHAKKTKKLRDLEDVACPRMAARKVPAAIEEERGVFFGDIEEPDVLEMPRPKVQFDDTLRYKSASLESLPVRGPEGVPAVRTARIHRLQETESAPRGPVPSARTNRKQKGSQSGREPGMEEIINVLDAIQNVVVSNIANKSSTVRSDIRAARDRLVREAAADLLEMREESVGHYNSLLALENEYANINRKLNDGFESVANINTDICEFVRQILNVHDRGSLPKKMTQSLFSAALPACFQKF